MASQTLGSPGRPTQKDKSSRMARQTPRSPGRPTQKKIIYFVRHAEALHNVKEREAVQQVIASGETRKCQQEAARKAVLKGDDAESLRDAPLSADGTEQARSSGRQLSALVQGSVFSRPDVVLVSPLRRALMTATELFLDGNNDKGNSPRFVAVEALREKRTGLVCDERSSVAELSAEFPHVDFTDVTRGLPAVPMGEDNPAVRSRAAAYLDDRLLGVEGNYLAVVSHKGWLRELRHTLRERLEGGSLRADFDVSEWHKTLFGNAEVRVAAFRWQDGDLASVVSRSVDSAISMVGDGFEFALGPPESGFSMFLANRTTKVHFISVSEGRHNVAVREAAGESSDGAAADRLLLRGDGRSAAEHPLYDAELTAKGTRQAEAMRDYLARRPSGFRPFTAFDLVVVSPLTRACETALRIFGSGPGEYAGMRCPPPRILVREECRERYGRYVCDGRRSVTDLRKDFPSLDFSEMPTDGDELHGEERESAVHCRDRAVLFLEWLSSRPEGCVAVVTNTEFLRHLFGQFGDTLQEEDRDHLQRSTAGNCELRSVVLCSHKNQDVPCAHASQRLSTIRVSSGSSPQREQSTIRNAS